MEGRGSIWVGKQRLCSANRAHKERLAVGWRVSARVPQGSCTTYVWTSAMSTPRPCAATPPRGVFFGRIAGARGPFSRHRSVLGAGLCAVRRTIVSTQVAPAHFCLFRGRNAALRGEPVLFGASAGAPCWPAGPPASSPPTSAAPTIPRVGSAGQPPGAGWPCRKRCPGRTRPRRTRRCLRPER